MRVLVDELPVILTKFFPGHEVRTAQQMGWAGIKNSELLSLAEANFDAFVTADRNLKFQTKPNQPQDSRHFFAIQSSQYCKSSH